MNNCLKESTKVTVIRHVINALSLIVIVVIGLVDGNDLIQFLLSNGLGYPIGSEAAGFRYATRTHFLCITILSICVGVFGLGAPYFAKNRWHKLGIRIVAAFLLICETVLLIASGD